MQRIENSFLTPRQFAAVVHHEQKRKGKDVPYFTHLNRVVELLASVNADQEVQDAGWLHDCVEDQDVSIDFIRKTYGERVANIVDSVTEHDKSLPWEIRKAQKIPLIASMNHDSLLLKAADNISNLEELVRDLKIHGEVVFINFNAGKEQQLNHKREAIKAISEAWPENPLLPQLLCILSQFERSCQNP